jgi:hypothetical protein
MKWITGFRTGHMSTEGEERSARTMQVTVPENMDAFHSMILDDPRISAKKVAETLAMSQESIGYIRIIHETLYMRTLSGNVLPKCLNAPHPSVRCAPECLSAPQLSEMGPHMS